MLRPKWMQRGPQYLIDAVVSFLALHGALNLAGQTAVAMTVRLFAIVAGLTLAVAIIGQLVLRPKGGSQD